MLGTFLFASLLMWSPLEELDIPVEWPRELGWEPETEEVAFAGLDDFLEDEFPVSPFVFLPNQFCIVCPQNDWNNW